jgi:hypothetical protein
MKMAKLVVALLIGAIVVLSSTAVRVSSEEAKKDEGKKETVKFVGVQACKACHNKKAGPQYDKWAATKHAKAYETLATDEAKKIAKEKKIEDPQKSDACLKCHTTGNGQPKEAFEEKFDVKLGVQCETCHGPASKHLAARKAAIKEGKKEPPSPDEFTIKASLETCKSCHNKESPTHKEFCFREKYLKEMHHPLKELSKEAKEKLEAELKEQCGCKECKEPEEEKEKSK